MYLSDHTKAVLQAVFVVILWATSWVLIKIGLGTIPALTFAGLRYVLAFSTLLIVALRPARLAVIRKLPPKTVLRLAVLGLLLYAGAQGAQFMGLSLLPAITMNLLLSFTGIAVAILSMVFLGEHPRPLQWVGIGLYLVGVFVYFSVNIIGGLGSDVPISGIVVAMLCVLANAVSAVMGRHINRAGDLDPFTITVISMGVGSVVLLITGIVTQGFPAFDWRGWLIIAWLAVVNTGFAFTLWNHTLRTLSAMESTIINSLMMVFIPLLAWMFLGEHVTTRQGIGMVIAGIGILTVQIRRSSAISRQPAAVIDPVPDEIH